MRAAKKRFWNILEPAFAEALQINLNTAVTSAIEKFLSNISLFILIQLRGRVSMLDKEYPFLK
jgi:hypothetical protein